MLEQLRLAGRTLVPEKGAPFGPLPPMLVALTVLTGLVDAVSYLALGRVFVANMTGNVIFLGLAVDPNSGLSVIAAVVAIGGRVLGALTGGRAAHTLDARPARWLATAFTVEALLIGLVALLTGVGVAPLTGDGRFATIALLATAL